MASQTVNMRLRCEYPSREGGGDIVREGNHMRLKWIPAANLHPDKPHTTNPDRRIQDMTVQPPNR